MVFYGGQGVSPAVFLAASLDKNHAHEMDHDWTYEASNSSRSLAVTLANNGYQVSLVVVVVLRSAVSFVQLVMQN